jgi:hypothetical protein
VWSGFSDAETSSGLALTKLTLLEHGQADSLRQCCKKMCG